MNRGNATLKSVSHGRPEIARSPSGKQSVAASTDYHSYSDHTSDASSSSGTRPNVLRWSTPPSQARSPESGRDQAQTEATMEDRALIQDQPVFAAPASVRTARRTQTPAEGTMPTVPAESGSGPSDNSISPPTPGLDDMPYIRYAIDQITREGADPTFGRPPTASSTSTYPVERVIPPAHLVHSPFDRSRRPPFRPEDLPPVQENPPMYIPVEAPRASPQHPPLNFVPPFLRPPAIMILVFFTLLMIAALIFCAIWSPSHRGLVDYNGMYTARYFLFQFVPQILAFIILLYTLTIWTTAVRVLPYVCLASESVNLRSSALFLDLYPKNFLLPNLTYCRRGTFMVGACLVGFWLTTFTIPLQSALFHVRLESVEGERKWRWVTVVPIAWTLVVLYGLLIVALLLTTTFFFRRKTGLKWDPTSLADIIALLQRSNNLDDYNGSEIFRHRREFYDRLKNRSDRLGYWKLRDEPDRIFYTIGEEGLPTRRYSLQRGKLEKQSFGEGQGVPVDVDLESQQPSSRSKANAAAANIHSPLLRRRFIPWYLRDTFVVAWIVIAIVLLIALIVLSFVNRALERGFDGLLDATPNELGFSPSGMLYSFLPSLIGLALFLLWQSFDLFFRATQPFAMLSHPEGASADESILLDYPSCSPGEVTVKAAAAGHWKVAWISLISLLAIVLPILSGGIFWPVYATADREVRVVAHMKAFYALLAFLVLYTLSFLLIWPRRKRYLPHSSTTLAEIISFLYQSSLRREKAFHEPRSKTDLITNLMSSSPGETRLARYFLGPCAGLDGKEHLSIDRLRRQKSDTSPAEKPG